MNNPFMNNIYYGNFPVGTEKNFNFLTSVDLMKQIITLRKTRYHICLNNMGDMRENFIGSLIKPEKNISVIWDKGHPFRNLVRQGGTYLLTMSIPVEKNLLNIYDINNHIARSLGCTIQGKPEIYVKENNKIDNLIAIHPVAGQKHKLWQWNKWKILIKLLVKQNFNIWIFCSEKEKDKIEDIFADVINKNTVIQCGNLEEFFRKLSSVKLLIGLDSFSHHAAWALGVPAIMLNGGNDYRIWLSPGAKVISKGNTMCYPCYNRPACEGKNSEYKCMKSIEVEEVLELVKGVSSDQ